MIGTFLLCHFGLQGVICSAFCTLENNGLHQNLGQAELYAKALHVDHMRFDQ